MLVKLESESFPQLGVNSWDLLGNHHPNEEFNPSEGQGVDQARVKMYRIFL